jgi:MFS family permease
LGDDTAVNAPEIKPQGATPTKGGTRPIWALYGATAVSVTGDGAFLVAAPLLAASITSDPLAVGLVSACFTAPWLVVGLAAGALADRWPRRRLMITADLARAILLGGLAFATATGHITIAGLAAVVLLAGVAQCFFDSAAQAAIVTVVGRDRTVLDRANGRFWSLDTVGRSMLGPPVGSSLFQLGRSLPFWGDAATFLVSAAFVSRLPHMPASGPADSSLVRSVRDGVAHVVHNRELRALTLSMGGYNLGYNIAAGTLVLYVTRVLGVRAGAYGLLFVGMAVGGVLAGWRAASLIRRHRPRVVQATMALIQAAVWLLAAATTNPWALAVGLVLVGGASTLATTVLSTSRQTQSPDGLVSRVVAATRLVGVGSAAVGALVGGAIARVAGLEAPLWAAGAVLILVAALTWPRSSS